MPIQYGYMITVCAYYGYRRQLSLLSKSLNKPKTSQSSHSDVIKA